MSNYEIEITDTYGNEANYSWLKRYTIAANTRHGAICKLARQHGSGWKMDFDTGEIARYNLKNAAICLFITRKSD